MVVAYSGVQPTTHNLLPYTNPPPIPMSASNSVRQTFAPHISVPFLNRPPPPPPPPSDTLPPFFRPHDQQLQHCPTTTVTGAWNSPSPIRYQSPRFSMDQQTFQPGGSP